MNKPFTGLTSRALAALGVATALVGVPTAQAGVDSVVTFSQSGRVDIILTGNAGGFDHLLEPVLVGGNAPFSAAVPTSGAWMVGTDGNGSLLALVGNASSPFSPTNFNFNWGTFDVVEAGQEISFRLTNINTDRIGGTDPDALGTINSQVFTGSGAINNTTYVGGSVAGATPGTPVGGSSLPGGYTFVDFVSLTQINVAFTDLFVNGAYTNMAVTLMLTPVPEPGTAALWLAGLGAMTWVAWRRRG